MLKLWGRTSSSNVRKVTWCLEELELPFQRIDAGREFGVVDTPEYRALNPNGLVPCIEDDGVVLWESNVILRYLWARYGQKLPVAEQARAERWMDWTLGTLIPAYVPLFVNLVFKPEAERDLAVVAEAVAKTNALLAIVDAELSKQPYLSGRQFGVGDIPLGVVAHVWHQLPVQRADLPFLRAWYERLLARPAYRLHAAVRVI